MKSGRASKPAAFLTFKAGFLLFALGCETSKTITNRRAGLFIRI